MSLHQSAANLLDQLDCVASQLSDEQFSRPLQVLSGSSVGQHVRHTLEFFICLIEARNEAVLNYDNRRHDPFIERELLSARNVIRTIKNFLSNNEPDRTIRLEANYEIDSDEVVRVHSSFYRELAYTMEHAVHHMALIKIGIRTAYEHVDIPDHFGVASSTVRYQKLKKTE